MPFPSLIPNRLTMEGMIDQSNKVLDEAAKMDRKGALSLLFQRAKGVMMISVAESAVIVSGAVGTGICMVKDEATGKWSPPCCCGLTQTGWGVGFGAQLKDIIVFAFDDKSVHSFTGKAGLKVNAGTSATLGTYSMDAGTNLSVSSSGVGAGGNVANYRTGGTATIAFSKGAYLSASVSGAIVGPRDHVNHGFYGKNDLTAHQILFGKDELIPAKKEVKALEELYNKLDLLSKGAVQDVNPEAFEAGAEDVPDATINMIETVANEVTKQLDSEKPATEEVQTFG